MVVVVSTGIVMGMDMEKIVREFFFHFMHVCVSYIIWQFDPQMICWPKFAD